MVAFNEIRAAIDTQLSNVSGFRRSKYPADYIARNPKSRLHLGYSVDLESTNAIGTRQRRSNAIMLQTTARVVFAYKLRPLAIYPTDYDLALDVEKTVILQCLNSYSSIQAGIEIRYDSSTRRFTDSLEFLIFDIQFFLIHSIRS